MQGTEGRLAPGTETSWAERGGNCTGEVVLTLLTEPEVVSPVGNGCSFSQMSTHLSTDQRQSPEPGNPL